MPHVELPQAEFKVVMLGDTNAGKTSVVLRFAEGYFRDAERSSTIGAFFITKRIQTSNGITCKIQIWDTAGQAQFRSMAPMYYRSAAAAIICYDVTSPQSYRVMTEWLDELHRSIPAGSIVIAIAATKYDTLQSFIYDNNNQDMPQIPPPSPEQDQQQHLSLHREAENLAKTLGHIYVNTSAKDNTGIHDLFQKVAERVLWFRKQGEMGASHVPIPVTPGAVASTTLLRKSNTPTHVRSSSFSTTISKTNNNVSALTNNNNSNNRGSPDLDLLEQHMNNYSNRNNNMNSNQQDPYYYVDRMGNSVRHSIISDNNSNAAASTPNHNNNNDDAVLFAPEYHAYQLEISSAEDDFLLDDVAAAAQFLQQATTPRNNYNNTSTNNNNNNTINNHPNSTTIKTMKMCSDGGIICDLFSASTRPQPDTIPTDNNNSDGTSVSCCIS